MANPMRLSELPDFLPAGDPGSPERRACALGTFTNREANARFMHFAARLAATGHASADPAQHHLTSALGALENGAANAS